MKRKIYLILAIIFCTVLAGCSGKKTKDGIRTEMDFTVVPRDEVPEELKNLIEEKKAEEFSMSYGIGGYLYIIKGYGSVSTGGYSIRVDSVEQTEDEIYFHSTLLGPEASEPVNKIKTFPYIVIKTEYTDKKIVFE